MSTATHELEGLAQALHAEASTFVAVEGGYRSRLFRFERDGRTLIAKVGNSIALRREARLLKLVQSKDIAPKLLDVIEYEKNTVLLLEDLGDWSFGRIAVGFAPKKVLTLLESLAKLHEAPIGSLADKVAADWLALIRPSLSLLNEESDVPPIMKEALHVFASRSEGDEDLLLEQETDLCHGDAHPENIATHGDDIRWIDWELGGRGCGLLDVCSLLLTSLTPRDIVEKEDEWIDHYLSQRTLDETQRRAAKSKVKPAMLWSAARMIVLRVNSDRNLEQNKLETAMMNARMTAWLEANLGSL